MLDAFWFQTFFLDIIVFEVSHLWHPQKVANKWRSHFHHPQKLARDLLFKIMESANAWQILRTPLTSPFCVDIINVCFFSVFFFLSLVCLMSECKWNFEFYENSVKLSPVKLSKKLSKLIFPTISVTFWTTFWLSLCQ